jgi:hypothetical protein
VKRLESIEATDMKEHIFSGNLAQKFLYQEMLGTEVIKLEVNESGHSDKKIKFTFKLKIKKSG